MKTIKHKRFFIPDNWLELMFGLGASIVIIGALLKITHSDFIFSGNVWLTLGLVTEAVIFGISGVKGFMTIDPDGFESGDDIETLEVETHELAKAVATSISKITIGTSCKPAFCAANHLLSPATISYLPGSTLSSLTAIG